MAVYEDYESAYTGREIDDRLGKATLVLESAPTSATVGVVGQMAVAGSLLYLCTAASENSYTWERVVPVIPSIAQTTKILKGNNAGNAVEATAGTDYQAAILASGILKGDGAGGVSAAAAGTDYQEAITASGILKGNGAGGVSAAVPGTDYQPPLSFYSTPTAQNTVTTESEMGTRLQSYTSGTSTTWSGTVNCGQAMVANPATGRTSVSITLGTAKATTQTSEWYAAFKAGSGCSVTVTPPSGKTLKWKDGVPTWTANHFYELSFVMAGSYILVAVLDTDLS